MDSAKIKIIDFFFDTEKFVFSLNLNLWVFLLILLLFWSVRYLLKLYRVKTAVDRNVQAVKLKYSLGGAEVEYEIVRNYQNIEIAHKIYIELITRKAAIEIEEEDKDVIVEVYDSWYSLFQITRNELMLFSGTLLKDNNTSQELIRMLTDILNEGLRPHLTKYQAKFRKWYTEELEKNSNQGKSPQEIQKSYSEFTPLMESIIKVNKLLIEYSKQLRLIIDGK